MKTNILKNKFYLGLSALSVLLLLLAWTYVSISGGGLIPTPFETFKRFIELLYKPVANGTIFIHLLVSLKRVIIAFLIASFAGIFLGVMLGWNKRFNAFFGPIFEILRPIPPIAWIPLVILWFGIGETPKVVIVFIGSFVPIVLNTFSGIKMIDSLLISAGKVLGANERQLLWDVAMPASLPAILAGMKTALGSGWMCVLAAEMVVAKQGVGFLIVRGMESGDSSLIIVCMIVIGLVSALITFSLTKFERKMCPWQTR
ncbi:NitT/TauT family transport system permease protein/sulfonate transport system permease protein [Anaerobacterium chartisolvens]|uniref:NitT/TauT family transport system permease protein/sulfonate transport system permease protein n=1 Tax=Anaerobacterium chartisolvens TaxID=1297424 RepID=A0A369BK63_9FIRM|nr:ABC transporter permease [Anaerobacterium chartisolvens]RCX20084.1 NitT/TauT family transport system permease protein/sulfonate transport system permease protein [Anaerobacterium chartisolvens]